MAGVADILIALNGYFEPTGVYSFEFRKSDGSPITEIFFLLPPESVDVGEGQRSELSPTLTGGYYTDYGNEFKDIQISGSSHFFYAGRTNNPATDYGSSGNLGIDGFIDGYTEFIKLRYMISRYRDYTLTTDGKITAPDFDSLETAEVNALKQWVDSQIDNGAGALADEVDMIWHDYDYDEHWIVRMDKLNMKRSKDDPWSVVFDIKLEAFERDTQRKTPPTGFNNQKLTAPEKIKETFNMEGQEHEETRPDTITTVTAGGNVPTPNYNQEQESSIPPNQLEELVP